MTATTLPACIDAAELRVRFLTILPRIETHARIAFRDPQFNRGLG